MFSSAQCVANLHQICPLAFLFLGAIDNARGERMNLHNTPCAPRGRAIARDVPNGKAPVDPSERSGMLASLGPGSGEWEWALMGTERGSLVLTHF